MTYDRSAAVRLIEIVDSGLMFAELAPYAKALRAAVAEVDRLTTDLRALQPVVGAAEIVRDWHGSELVVAEIDLALDELARSVDAYLASKAGVR